MKLVGVLINKVQVTITTTEFEDKVIAHYYIDKEKYIRDVIQSDISKLTTILVKTYIDTIYGDNVNTLEQMFADPDYKDKSARDAE